MTGPTRTSPPWSRLSWPSLNGVCGGPDHVDHEGGLREHGHVAAVGLMDAGAHPLRDEALQLGMNGVVVLAHDVPGRLRPPGGAFHLLVEQIDGRHTLVAQPTFCSCSERSPAKSHGAATMLGIPRQTLESRIRALRINKHQFKSF